MPGMGAGRGLSFRIQSLDKRSIEDIAQIEEALPARYDFCWTGAVYQQNRAAT